MTVMFGMKRTLGKALEQLAQHLHEGRVAGVEHHADLPLLRLLHDEAVRDIAHFARRRADALCDLLAHALLMVQGAVYRSRDTPQRSAICCIVTIKSLSCVICTYTISQNAAVRQMLHLHENVVLHNAADTMIALFLCGIP